MWSMAWKWQKFTDFCRLRKVVGWNHGLINALNNVQKHDPTLNLTLPNYRPTQLLVKQWSKWDIALLSGSLQTPLNVRKQLGSKVSFRRCEIINLDLARSTTNSEAKQTDFRGLCNSWTIEIDNVFVLLRVFETELSRAMLSAVHEHWLLVQWNWNWRPIRGRGRKCRLVWHE